jgi:hypothetical protein
LSRWCDTTAVDDIDTASDDELFGVLDELRIP